MKKVFIVILILVALYMGIIILPTGLYYMLPCDGAVSEVQECFELKQNVMSQWSPVTGIWAADFTK